MISNTQLGLIYGNPSVSNTPSNGGNTSSGVISTSGLAGCPLSVTIPSSTLFLTHTGGVASGTSLVRIPDMTGNWTTSTGGSLNNLNSPPTPEISLQGNAITIEDGDVSPTATDHTDFGITGISGKIFTYTIQNLGPANLTLSGTPRVQITGSADFTVISQPSSGTIAANGSLTFQVQFLPTGINGLKTATISIANNDTDENPYTFAIQGYKVYATPDTKRGYMLVLDETTNKHIAVPHNTSLDINTGQLTLSAWIRKTATSGFDNILMKGSYGYGFIIDDNDRLGYWSDSDYLNCFNSGANTIPDNEWTHVAVVVNAGVSTTFYINGVEAGTSTTLAQTTINNNTGTLALGVQDVATFCNCNNFDGNLDEIQIWNVALTQAQIRERMHLTLSGAESGLLAYYQFNEASGNVIDAIAGNNGTLEGGANRTTSTVSVGKGTSTRLTAPVEMSENGLAYQQIAFVDGKGSSNTPIHYQISTINPNQAYYRLKQVDFDGKFSYSPVVFVEGMETLKVYPNPNNGTFSIKIGTNTEPVNVKILNAQGVQVFSQTLSPSRLGTSISPSGLGAGIYFLHTTVAGKSKITKVVIYR